MPGRYNCVGKQLAMMEMRLVIALTLWKYDFALAPGEDGKGIFDDTLDLMILKPGKLNLVFTKRRGS